jgi:O-antigen ligase
MTDNRSYWVLGLFLSVIVLLPFSRLAELPILILSLMGVYGCISQWEKLKSYPQFYILSLVFGCYFLMIMISALDSYWQVKTVTVAVSSIRFYLSTIAVLIFIRPKHFSMLIKSITVIVIFISFDALFQSYFGVDVIGRASYEGRLNGVFGESHPKLGPVLALFLPVAMIGLRHYPSLVRWLCIVAAIVVIILTGTRSAWIMMIFTLLAYWFHHVKKRRFQLMLKAIIVAAILIGSLWSVSTEFQQRVNRSMALFDGTQAGLDFALADRLSIWKTSWNMIEHHPINGIGAHAFREAYPQFAGVNDSWQQKDGVGMHAHLWVLEVISDTGLIGLLLISFAIFKLLVFVKGYYHPHYSWAFMIALISAFLPITSTYSIFASFWSICIFLVGASLILVSRPDD